MSILDKNNTSSGWSTDPATATPAPYVYTPPEQSAPIVSAQPASAQPTQVAQTTPAQSAQNGPAMPTDQQIKDAFNNNSSDPAAVYKLMQDNGVSATSLARVLNVNIGDVMGYLGGGVQQTNSTPWYSDQTATKSYDPTTPSTQTQAQFMASITPDMLDANGKFKPPEQGGNYMDTGLTPQQVWDIANQKINHWQDDTSYVNPAHDSMLDPHWQPGVTDSGGVVGNLWRGVRPIAAMLAMAYGGEALAGAGAGTGTAATVGGTEVGGSAGIGSGTVLGGGIAPTANGLAGTMGMSPGLAANAVNAGLANTGVSLIRGNNIGDSVKSGIIGAVLSPVGTMAGNAATSTLGNSVSPLVSNIAGNVAGNAAQGGVRAVLTGQDVGKGIINGGGAGLINSAGQYMGSAVTGATESNIAGNVASNVTRAVLSGGDPLSALASSGVGAAANIIANNIPGFADLSPTQKSMIMSVVSSAMQGKAPTQALINQVTNLAMQQITGAKPNNPIRTGGWSLQ